MRGAPRTGGAEQTHLCTERGLRNEQERMPSNLKDPVEHSAAGALALRRAHLGGSGVEVPSRAELRLVTLSLGTEKPRGTRVWLWVSRKLWS